MRQFVSEELYEEILNYLRQEHSDIYRKAFSDEEYREVLKKIVIKNYGEVLDEEKAEKVIRDMVGLGIIEELIKENNQITDIGFDGTKLIVEGNGIEKYSINSISEDQVLKLIAKFSNSTNREFSNVKPILNTSKDYLRLNAVVKNNAPSGTTMSIRVSRPFMAVKESDFGDEEKHYAPIEILKLLKAMVESRSNVWIIGDTGAGKTELQKLMLSWIPFEERIDIIESVIDLYAKQLWPEKDIFSWLANENASIEDLINYAGLRTNPDWIVVGEVLGKESNAMMQAILTGHSLITTGHAYSVKAIPRRAVGMAKNGNQIDEKSFIDDFYNYVHFGIRVKKNKKGIRYIAEIGEFNSNHTVTTIFKRKLHRDRSFSYEYKQLSDDFFERALEYECYYEGIPEYLLSGAKS